MNDEPIILPINGTLDLHAFAPLDLHTLIPDYLGQCRRQGVPRVRIIHGKGIGTLRRTVHAIFCNRSPGSSIKREEGQAPSKFGACGGRMLILGEKRQG